MQWLNVSFSAWSNAKRQRVGHVFQGRFRSTLIDGFAERVAIGSRAFLEQARKWVKSVSAEQPERSFVASRIPFDRIVAVVEQIKGEAFADFRNRHGDGGLRMVLYLARRSGKGARPLWIATGRIDVAGATVYGVACYLHKSMGRCSSVKGLAC